MEFLEWNDLKEKNPQQIKFTEGFNVSAPGLEPGTLCLKGRCSTTELCTQQLSAKFNQNGFQI